MNNIFGWSYPPGCSGTPFDDGYFCEVCWKPESQCDCPECPECGSVGRAECYTEGHMIMSPDRVAVIAAYKQEIKETDQNN
jgi:hypothetical protein